MKTKGWTLRITAMLMLICMLLPFVPQSALKALAAVTADNILIFDDFQNEPSAGYYDDDNGHYNATLTDGHLVLEKVAETDYNTTFEGTDNTAYLFPYTAMESNTGITKLTVSFEFSLIDTPDTGAALFLAYGAKVDATAPTTNAALQTAPYNYGIAGLRLANGTEFAGRVQGGERKRQYRGHYMSGTPTETNSDGTRTDTNYLLGGNHTFTAQIQSNGASRVYIDGIRYQLEANAESWADTGAAAFVTLQGLFGIDLWKVGTKIAVDNFLVYEGHGSLTTTPTSTVTKNTTPAKVILHDDFNDPFAYDYADASTDWTVGKTTSSVENGSLILDATGGVGYSDYYPLPYEVPEGTTAFTAELKFRILQPYQPSGTVNSESYEAKNRTDVMLVYGDSQQNDTRVYFNGLRIGDYNHRGTYNYDQNHAEFWGTITSNGMDRLYRTLSNADILGNGFMTGETYTLVVQVDKSAGASCYIKEVDGKATATWASRNSTWDGVSGTSPYDNHDDVSGFLGFYCAQAAKIALDEITVYDGIYTPLTDTVTDYIYDDFVMSSVYDYDTSSATNNSNGTMQVSADSVLVTRKTTWNVLHHTLPHTLPAATTGFTANTQFSVDLSGKTSGTDMDVMLSFGQDANGYWSTGLRIKQTVIEEFILYSNLAGYQQGRCFRRLATNYGWGNMTDASAVFTLKTVVTEHTVKNYLILANGTTYSYAGTDDKWTWDGTSYFPGYCVSSTAVTGATKATDLGDISLSFTKQNGGNLGFYANAGLPGAKIYYKNIRVAYDHTKAITPDGTLLYHESFDSADAGDTYNSTANGYTTVVENGALKLEAGSGSQGKAYMLPVTLTGQSSFTAEIVCSIDGVRNGFDVMLLYGAQSYNYGWVSGYRFSTGTEWMATLQGKMRRAYRGMIASSESDPALSYGGSAHETAPVSGQKYTVVIEVTSGRTRAYVKGYPSNAWTNTLYSPGSAPNNVNGEDNCMLDNVADYSVAATTNYVTINSFANCLDGQLGLVSEYGGALYVDSITVTAGLAANPDTKQVADGTILYQNDFNDANIDDYTGQVGFDAALVDGALSLTKVNGPSTLDMYLLPGSKVAGAKAMTVSFDFYADELSPANASVMLGYNAADKNNYRFCGWRQGSVEENAYEQFGYIKTVDTWDANTSKYVTSTKVGGRYYRTCIQSLNGTGAEKKTSAILEDGAWHKMTIVITADKAVMYIDGQRVLWICEENGTVNADSSEGSWYMERYSTDAASQSYVTDPPLPLTGGMLGFFLHTTGTSFKVDNFLCVAGTQAAASGGLTYTENYAGQATLDAAQINGTRDTAYDRSGKLATTQTYKALNTTIASATTEVLWDMGYLYLYTEVTDATASDSDRVTYYITEDGTLSYQAGEGAYTLTAYRNNTYVAGNAAAANGIKVSVTATDAGYVVEAKIPLLTKGAQTLAAGSDIGFNYVVTDVNTDGAPLGWSAWTPGYGTFTTSPDSLNRLTLVLSASPTGDDTVIWPYFLVGGVALVGIVGAAWVLTKKKKWVPVSSEDKTEN